MKKSKTLSQNFTPNLKQHIPNTKKIKKYTSFIAHKLPLQLH